jgi:hypothetical protein
MKFLSRNFLNKQIIRKYSQFTNNTIFDQLPILTTPFWKVRKLINRNRMAIRSNYYEMKMLGISSIGHGYVSDDDCVDIHYIRSNTIISVIFDKKNLEISENVILEENDMKNDINYELKIFEEDNNSIFNLTDKIEFNVRLNEKEYPKNNYFWSSLSNNRQNELIKIKESIEKNKKLMFIF